MLGKDNEKINKNMKALTSQYNNIKNKLSDTNKELQNTKDELKEIKKGIRFEDDKLESKSSYDIVIDISSMYDLISTGWKIKYPKGKEEYEIKNEMDTIIIGVIGNRNKGKSFIL